MKLILITGIILLVSFTLNAQWTRTSGPYGGTVNSLASSGHYLFAGTETGIYRSPSSIINWSLLGNHAPASAVHSIIVSDQTIFAGCYEKGIYLSSDTGITWKQIN